MFPDVYIYILYMQAMKIIGGETRTHVQGFYPTRTPLPLAPRELPRLS